MRGAASRGDTRAAVDADFAFHFTIVRASGSRLLREFWERMRLATTTFLTISKSHRSLPEITERHVEVLEALRSQDPDKAEQAMRRHIEEPGHWLRAAMEEAAAQKPKAKARARRAPPRVRKTAR
jgi:DNA-binding GntR family transcriptional regulator